MQFQHPLNYNYIILIGFFYPYYQFATACDVGSNGKEFFPIALYNFFILIGFFYPYRQLATVVQWISG